MPILVVAHFAHHLLSSLLQPVTPSIRDELGGDYTQAGWLFSSYSLAYGMSQLPAGWLADRVGARIMVTAGVAGVAFFGLLVGLSPNYALIITFLVFLGVMGGGYHPASSPLVSASVDRERRGQALGLHQIGGTASFIVTPLLAALAVLFHWRAAFIVLSLIVLVFGVYLHSLLKRKGHDSMPGIGPGVSQVITINPPGYLRRLVALTVLGVATQVFIFTTVSFVPLLVTDEFGMPNWAGSVILFVPHLAGLIAGPYGGHLSDRIGKTRVMLVVALAAGPAIYLLSLSNLLLLPVVLLLMGTCQYTAMPVTESYIITHSPARRRSTWLGIYYMFSRGGPVIGVLVGRMIDRLGFDVAFASTGATMFAVALLSSLFLWGNHD